MREKPESVKQSSRGMEGGIVLDRFGKRERARKTRGRKAENGYSGRAIRHGNGYAICMATCRQADEGDEHAAVAAANLHQCAIPT